MESKHNIPNIENENENDEEFINSIDEKGLFIRKSENDDSSYMTPSKQYTKNLNYRPIKAQPIRHFDTVRNNFRQPVFENDEIKTKSKTRPCNNIINTGICLRENCSFADAIDQLNPTVCSFGIECNRQFSQLLKKTQTICVYRHHETIEHWAERIGLDISKLPETQQQKPVIIQRPSMLKTKICQSFEKGIDCVRLNCYFAHGRNEIRHAECSHGDKCFRRPGLELEQEQTECTFMHSSIEDDNSYRERINMFFPANFPEIAVVRPTTTENTRNTGRYKTTRQHTFTRPILTKTKVCNNMKSGGCNNTVCPYAHTLDELNDLLCSFGSNCYKEECRFKHENEDKEQYRNRIGFINPFILNEVK